MHIPIHLSARRTVRVLFMFLAVLLLFHVAVVVAHFKFHIPLVAMTELFDLDRETNLPALFNVLLFFAGATLFFVLGHTVQGKARRPWNLMALVFGFLGLDEGSQIHEKLIFATQRLMGAGEGGEHFGMLYYAWIIPYAIAMIALLAILTPWLLKMEPRLRWGLLGAGAIYLLGAVFFESLGGRVTEAAQVGALSDEQLTWLPCLIWEKGSCFLYSNPTYVTLYTFEETFEMSGLILCVGVLLRTLERRNADVGIAFAAS
ncbi:MAG: hypothetical protein ABI432_03820 [Flavobacteriales bacterium]